MAKRGRKKWTPTPEILQKIRSLARTQLKINQITPNVGLHPNQWSIKSQEFPELLEAFELGRADGTALLTNKGFDIAMNGNTEILKLFLKSKCDFKENDPETIVHQPITFKVNGKEIEID